MKKESDYQTFEMPSKCDYTDPLWAEKPLKTQVTYLILITDLRIQFKWEKFPLRVKQKKYQAYMLKSNCFFAKIACSLNHQDFANSYMASIFQ